MAQKSIRSELAAAQWRERIEEWRQSGQSQQAFCRERGISAYSLSHWKCKLSVAPAGEAPAARADGLASKSQCGKSSLAFRELAWPAASSADLELVLPGGWSIRLSSRFDAEALRRLLEVLEVGRC